MAISSPMSEEAIMRRKQRQAERALVLASTAIAAKIGRALRTKNIKNTEFAKMLGVTAANVTRYLSGKTNFELKTLVEIERVLDIRLINRDCLENNEFDKTKSDKNINKITLMPITRLSMPTFLPQGNTTYRFIESRFLYRLNDKSTYSTEFENYG